MTKFEDGPAAGETLILRRSPLFLRVVTDPKHNNRVDALDQLDDKPEEFENLTAYVRTGPAGFAFIDFSGKHKGQSGPCGLANYVVVPDIDQPSEETMRDEKAWRKWCWERATTLKAHGVA